MRIPVRLRIRRVGRGVGIRLRIRLEARSGVNNRRLSWIRFAHRSAGVLFELVLGGLFYHSRFLFLNL
jgi:hypothetical protein